ncbi:MAG: 1-acyl-sn-glycerol-3-phosphate acyltransferase [Clostridia bacterium]|nr:1-acyl-sn-glycerol-3-phosphate acyltransferase [Clostridia bacterium]
MKELRFKFTIAKNMWFILTHLPKAKRYIRETDIYNDEDRFIFAQEIMHRMRKSSKTETDIYGLENLPEKNGYIMYSNHQGKYDGIGILLSQNQPCRALWRKDTADKFVARECAGLIMAKLIDAEHELLKVLRILNEIANEVKDGHNYLIFPEGKYEENHNNLQEFKHGCFRSSLKSKAPIVPIAVYDSWKAMNTRKICGKVKTQIHYLEPIYYDEYKEMNEMQIADLVKSRIQARLDEIENGTVKANLSRTITLKDKKTIKKSEPSQLA